ncbi:glycosyltransferase [Dysgonomonas sp. Marseille-P4677]|uniref:glycosyltransferase family 2 protein n=1 Tax=Dysgonomonas sp. Marseille-P4677 TaxID=2364790 RepID=UPI001914066D|nr:glycosyltransferase family 2 protein [Dysgonomonas sp. Marseille-P4677]MBK5719449.1 glycosyltransferase [Dysgonomonas sp. Marseille-P4677]
MSSCKVSIITIVYNMADKIEATILSIINQTYSNIEYIIIDGGSIDGTVDIIKKYESKITYWVSEPDNGIYDAMNKGIEKATGDWINFMNSGDYLIDENVIEMFTNLHDSNADIVYGDTINNIAKMDISYLQKPYPVECIESNMIFCHQSAFVKTILMKAILFDTKYKVKSDYNFFLHCYRDNKIFQYISIPIAVFDYDTGVSSNFKINRREKAQIQGIEHKISWKMKYTLEYIIWKFRYYVKTNLPHNILKKYFRRRVNKYNKILTKEDC